MDPVRGSTQIHFTQSMNTGNTQSIPSNGMESKQTTSTFTDPAPQTTRLIAVLQDLENHIKRQNSLKYALVKGMVHGLGTVIGATVLVALLGGVLATTTDFFKGEALVISTQLPHD